MGLPSFLGGKPKKTTAPGMIAAQGGIGGTPGFFGNKPANTTPGLAPPPVAPPNALATVAGFAATNAARRARAAAGAGDGPTPKPAAAVKPTPRKLFDAGRAAMGLY